MSGTARALRLSVALLALAAIAIALFRLEGETEGLEIARDRVDGTPVTVFRKAGAPPAPAVVIAHGFAGSRQLMRSFSLTLARAGYVAVAFDFRGHGRNPKPLTGDVTEADGATRVLVAELDRMTAWARDLPGSDGRVMLLGHSMASDIVVRGGIDRAGVEAVVAVSMFTEQATATEPPNLLAISGEWEAHLREAALDVVGIGRDGSVAEGVTYGDIAEGTARRAAVAPNVEHVGVLYSPVTMAETRDWADAAFARESDAPLSVRGPAIVLLLGGIVALAWPLASLLPRLSPCGTGGAPAGWRALGLRLAVPAVATPLLLWPVETGFLPVLVADYLALHFALYGAITAGLLWRDGRLPRPSIGRIAAVAGTAGLVAAWMLGAFGLALDRHVASFFPHEGRAELIAVLAAGTLLYLLSDEWLTRGPTAPRGAYALSKLVFLLSLALAVALNLSDLFFLIIIFPVILLFFLIYGLVSGWVYRTTGHPGVAGLANAVAFAWALGVTFPLLGG